MTRHPYARWVNILLIASSAFALDIFTKFVIFKNLSPDQSIAVLPNIFHITLVLNKGAAFGIFNNQTVFFIALSAITILYIIFYIWRYSSYSYLITLPLGLIMGGAIGNLVDRVRFGYVIDFLDFRIWPVFNVADSAITVGAVILMWSILLKKTHNP